ncbi:MAG: phosphoenolpyruvate carboxykinase (ATP) [Candidatus Diapherotrites archaeon CG10_big_fil_rev_8_21_14_0_10_31_34]|nr:MAG: phosphoenolpyruvate carboxykinase (ATP) [Candidatus Diapherotrites archaeon CG10_big_fil_rev_8_21_14_0_10_31_34]
MDKKTVIKKLEENCKIIKNISPEELREIAKPMETTTEFGSASYVTKIRNRSAKKTFIVPEIKLGIKQTPIKEKEAEELAEKVFEYLNDKELIQINKTMCLNPKNEIECRLYVSKEQAKLAFMWNYMLYPSKEKEPEMISIHVPEWPETKIFCYPKQKITFCLGSDYFGEVKKSFLRMGMLFHKEKTKGLGLHAGSKLLKVKNKNNELQEVGFIMFGLSGTGKTTLTIHNHELTGEEGVSIRQDDVVFMDEKGFCAGTEFGFFIKTEGLDESQKVLYEASVKPTAIFENVKVSENGKVDFKNLELTANGRGVLPRDSVEGAEKEIDLEKAHKIIFITRREDIVPVIAKLTPEQAAAYFMLGESIETSAGDPTKAGQSKREVGTNPFITGKEEDEGNRLYEILKNNKDIECFVMNTGGIGRTGFEKGKNISIKLSTDIMKFIAQGKIEWKKDSNWNYLVPKGIEGIDFSEFDPANYYSKEEFEEKVNKLLEERKQWLAQFPGLKKEIVESIYK